MRTTMSKTIACTAMLTAIALATPAAASTNDTQYWQTLSANVKLNDEFQVTGEAIFRSSDRKGFYEIENSYLVGYKASKHVVLWAGYVFNPLYDHGDFTTREHRARQQISLEKYKLGNVALSGRLRAEQRWREGADGTGWRLRPYVKASLPIANEGKTQLVVTNEAFINLNTTSFQKTDGWDRTRSFVGINRAISKKVAIEGGYMLQHGYVRNGPDTNDHVLTVTLSGKF